jgi:hypothetical protein
VDDKASASSAASPARTDDPLLVGFLRLSKLRPVVA